VTPREPQSRVYIYTPHHTLLVLLLPFVLTNLFQAYSSLDHKKGTWKIGAVLYWPDAISVTELTVLKQWQENAVISDRLICSNALSNYY